MSLRTVTRKFGIAAPRVAVYTHLPWYWRWASMAIIITIVLGLAWGTFLLGRSFSVKPFDPHAATRETTEQALTRVTQENETLRAQVAALEQKLQIDRSTQDNLHTQLKSLTEQNAKIKEDLAFFQAIGGNTPGVSVQKFMAKAKGLPGEIHYQLLVVQSRQRAEHFRGRVEFAINVVDKGVQRTIVFPKAGEKAQPYVLGFKFFQRIEGVLKIPPETTATKVEARILELGVEAPVASQLAPIS